MKRSLWFVVGATAGVYVSAKAKQIAEAVTPEGLHDRFSSAQTGLRMLREEVVQEQKMAEAQLRERMGLAPLSTPELARRQPQSSGASGSPTEIEKG